MGAIGVQLDLLIAKMCFWFCSDAGDKKRVSTPGLHAKEFDG